MLNSQNVKFIPLAPASVANNATATLIVDRKGYDEVSFCVLQAAASATTKPLTLTVAQGDSTSSFTAITGYNGGTAATNSPQTVEAPTSATACPPIVLNVDCIGKARYLRLQMTPGTTQVLGAVAVLGRPAIGPNSLNEVIATQGTDGTHGTVTTTNGLVVGPGGTLS
jgi:hypothetical protein